MIQSAAVFDFNGRKVFHSTPRVNSRQFEETLNLSEGMYILRVTFENNSIASKKLIVANK
ncbi:MAG: T9SS type A sorting domain-containing protein [Cryomorphaceae bacterium]